MSNETAIAPARIDVGQFIVSQLTTSGYKPPEPHLISSDPYNRFAALSTNERVDSGLFKAIRNHNPGGYIVAVGCGMSVGLPLGFKEEQSPKGVVLIDTDRHVNAISKAFITAVKETNNITEFYNQFYIDPITNAEKFLKDDKEAMMTLNTMTTTKGNSIREQIDRSRGDYSKRVAANGHPSLDNILTATYGSWKKWIKEGKVTAILGSLTDKEIMNAVTNLPEFRKSTNVVYLSNIIDHIISRGAWKQCEAELTSFLHAISHYNSDDYPAIYLDTLRSFNYWLRVSKGVPNICAADVQFISQSVFPEEFMMPHLHYERRPKSFTPLGLSDIDNDLLENIHSRNYATLHESYKDIDQNRLDFFIKEIGDRIHYFGNIDIKYFGGLTPIDWVRFRFGEVVGQATASYLETKKRTSEHD
jgi:hypothetical protein